MTDELSLRPATEDEIAETLAFGLRHEGRKRVRPSSFVMKRPAAAAPTTSSYGKS